MHFVWFRIRCTLGMRCVNSDQYLDEIHAWQNCVKQTYHETKRYDEKVHWRSDNVDEGVVDEWDG